MFSFSAGPFRDTFVEMIASTTMITQPSWNISENNFIAFTSCISKKTYFPGKITGVENSVQQNLIDLVIKCVM